MLRGTVPNTTARLFVVLLVVILMGGCTLMRTPPTDPAVADDRFFEAEQAIRTGDLQGADGLLQAAEEADPLNPRTYLRLGNLLELAMDPPRAAAAYRRGIAHAQGTSELAELAYRCGLLAALKLDDRKLARELLSSLPQNDPRREDLAAALAIAEGDGRTALAHLNQARNHPVTAEQGALLSYHAARAYQLLGDIDHARTALYSAVNLAGRTAIVKDIEQLRNQLNPK